MNPEQPRPQLHPRTRAYRQAQQITRTFARCGVSMPVDFSLYLVNNCPIPPTWYKS